MSLIFRQTTKWKCKLDGFFFNQQINYSIINHSTRCASNTSNMVKVPIQHDPHKMETTQLSTNV